MRLVSIVNPLAPSKLAPVCLYEQTTLFSSGLVLDCVYSLMFPFGLRMIILFLIPQLPLSLADVEPHDRQNKEEILKDRPTSIIIIENVLIDIIRKF